MSPDLFLLVLIAAVLHASWNYAARKAEGSARVVWLAMWAACAAALPLVLWLVFARGGIHRLPREAGPFVAATGILHAAYFLLLAAAYRAGELSVVYPVARGTGVGLTAVLASPLFGESMSGPGIAGIAAIVCGVLLMSRAPSRHPGTSRGLVRALGVGVTIAAYSLTDKGGVMRADPVLYIWLMYLVCALAMAPFVLPGTSGSDWRDAVRRNGREILVIGVGSMGTYLIILYAFSRGPVGYVVAVREFSVAAGAVLGFALLRESISAWKVAAIVLVMAGVIVIRLGG